MIFTASYDDKNHVDSTISWAWPHDGKMYLRGISLRSIDRSENFEGVGLAALVNDY